MTGEDLKKAVLQAAVQGKLSVTNSSDSDVEQLICMAAVERKEAEKVSSKRSKVQIPTLRRTDKGNWVEKRKDGSDEAIETPYEIPEKWVWCRLAAVLKELVVPQRDKPKTFGGTIAWCRIEDAEGKYLNKANDGRYVTPETVKKMNLRVCPPGTVFAACSGASIGRVVISTIPCCTNQTFAGLICSSCLNKDYLYAYLQTVIPVLKKMGSGTALQYISQEKFNNMLIPVPPIEEQERIVAKLDEVMPLVEEYGRLQEQRDKLDAELPEKLRKAVLQAGIEGKLTDRCETDTPAVKLLRDIRAKRTELAAAKQIKLPKEGESIIYRDERGEHWERRVDKKGKAISDTRIEDEIPFEIPPEWQWARFDSLIELISGVDLSPGAYNDKGKGIPYLTGASNFENGSLIENRWTETPRRISSAGDLLFTCKGTVGEMAINTFVEAHIARQIMAIRPLELQVLPFVRYYLQVIAARVKANATGIIPGIDRSTLLESLIPVPPLEEQERIVAKLDEVMPLIEGLGR